MGNPSAPDIDGDVLAWQQFNGTDFDVWAAHIGQPPFVVAGTAADEGAPSVSGDRIAYLSGGQVHLDHVATRTDTPITNDAFWKAKVVLAGDLSRLLLGVAVAALVLLAKARERRARTRVL